MSEARTAGIPIRAAFDDVAELGPFFAASADPAEEADPTWRPVRDLYADPEPLAARIRQVSDALRTGDPKVAASIAYQGLAARLASPLIAVAAVHQVVPPWSPASLHWRRAVVGQWPLWESTPRARPVEPGQLPTAVAEVLVEPHLVALAEAVRRAVPVSERVLRGNAASAVVSAGHRAAQARPAAAGRVYELVNGLLATGWLAGAGGFESPGRFRRRSCCLYYRVPGGGLCGDCVLAGRGRRETRG